MMTYRTRFAQHDMGTVRLSCRGRPACASPRVRHVLDLASQGGFTSASPWARPSRGANLRLRWMDESREALERRRR